jgi:hypothetical protein
MQPKCGEQQNWQAEFSAFSNRFRETTGAPLGFLQLDVLWEAANKNRVVTALFRHAQTLKRQGLLGAIGIIYNGSGNTDELWIQSARTCLDQLVGLCATFWDYEKGA